MEKLEYWFNTKTKKVEQGKKSLSLNRIGPFETPQEAEQAPQLIAERVRKLEAEEDEYFG